jgi:cysteine synthase A
MSHWFQDNTLSIGNTPLVRLNRVTDGAKATVLAKIEGRNPAYSVKCRIGAALVWDAEKRGLLGPGKELVEPTSGNTGIALAFVAAARGYKLTLTMPETMSIERRKLLVAYGAKLVLTEGPKGMSGAIAKAEEIAASDPEPLRAPAAVQEPREPGHPRDHHRPRDLGRHRGRVDIFVSGVGTGGTITGVSRYFKNPRASRCTRWRWSPRPARSSRSAARASRSSPARTRSRASARASCPTCSTCRWSIRWSRSPTRRR